MIIECVGPPGSGKTTFVTEIAKSATNINSITEPVARSYTYRYFFLHPVFVLWFCYRIVKEGINSKTLSLTRYKLALYADTIGRLAWAENHKESFVLDEGLLQRLLSFYERQQSLEVLMRDVALVQHYTNGVICLDTSRPFSKRYRKPHPRALLGDNYLSSWQKTFSY